MKDESTRTTTFVVGGSAPGPAKLRNIQELHIKTMHEEGFFKFIRQSPPTTSAVSQTVKGEGLGLETERKERDVSVSSYVKVIRVLLVLGYLS